MSDSPEKKVTLRLLLVEDNPDDAELILLALRRGGYQVDYTRVDNAPDLTRELREADWELVLSDYAMPHFNGLAALKLVKEHNPDIPFIVISGTIGEEVAVEAMRKGAQDYLMKDNLTRLLPAIQRELADADERRARRAAEQTLRHQAYHDVLTGLPNRWLLRDRIEQAFAYAHRENHSLAVIFLDLDRFKNLNDTMGHITGDHLLRAVAERLKSAVTPWDTIARLGGDDFVLLLPDVGRPEHASEKADALLQLFQTPFVLSGQNVYVDASIGIAMYPENGRDADNLLKNAEAAMYYAKEQGRNNFQFCTSGIQEATATRFVIENELREAIKTSQLVLYYQPQFSLRSLAVTGLEALVRWRHPERGLVLPDKFIPVAEETGLIISLGGWVIQQALADLRHWRSLGLQVERLAINLSARQLFHTQTHDILQQSLEGDPVSAHTLELEITESGVMQDPEQAVQTLNAFKALGVSVAIDDFGTGYSSLSYLKRFPIDLLKIDRSFVRDITVDDDDAAIVRTILAMAQALNLQVIAEGVESEKQLKLLAALGCSEGQGYYYARPMPGEALEAFLRDKAPAIPD
ncbi:MAG: EAL domain-containing protein [Thiohalophilus sp.]|uniref:putative bifunctional diguanylate cyclase/phosphodiesterase n=1 Tax=Thiohalophilus sp. TaxID=3028392 RepID=UPI0028709763|nr:EAL domain-containing protein [Thiohalophilus sp.]MDR9436013.1 EAL domain-containing protein [Thiohalophilus sp.]